MELKIKIWAVTEIGLESLYKKWNKKCKFHVGDE